MGAEQDVARSMEVGMNSSNPAFELKRRSIVLTIYRWETSDATQRISRSARELGICGNQRSLRRMFA